MHRDALGSVVAASNPGYPTVVASLDAWGQRRSALNWNATPPPLFDDTQYPKIGRRAYTGHEQLDNLNLVHMNGRVYAPVIGRFMSPDPFIADAFDSQSLNRFSYVRNNPLSRVDPSGFFEECVYCFDVDFGTGQMPQWPGYLLPPGVTSLSFRWPSSVPRESGVEPQQLTPQFVEFDEATTRRAAQAGAAASFAPVFPGDPLYAICRSGIALCLDSLPQEWVDWSAGFGDVLCPYVCQWARESLLDNAGNVDTSSGSYANGEWAGIGGTIGIAGAEMLALKGAIAGGGLLASHAARNGDDAARLTAEEIRRINRSHGGTSELTGNADTVIANMGYRAGANEQAAVAIRDIAGRHLFDNGNKRTAQEVAERILGPLGDPAHIRGVIDRVALGELRTVEDIAAALGY